jgi:transposase
VKTDTIDSRILAQLLVANLIPEAHLRRVDNQIKQTMIRHRAFLVAMRTRVRNRINDIVNSQLLPTEMLATKPKNLFANRGKGENGVEWLKSLQ